MGKVIFGWQGHLSVGKVIFRGQCHFLVAKVINLVGKVGGREPGVIGPGFRVESSGFRV